MVVNHEFSFLTAFQIKGQLKMNAERATCSATFFFSEY